MNGSFPWVWVILGAVIVAGAGVGIYVWRRRVGYIKTLTGRGWRFESSPPLEIALGLNVPPFGLGLERATDEHIIGEAGGRPFQVFDYKGPAGKVRVAAMPLPLPLPELYLTTVQPRPGGQARAQAAAGPWLAFADDADLAQTFQASTAGPVSAFISQIGAIDLAVDGDQLILLGPPTEADALAGFLTGMAGIAGAVDGAALARFQCPTPQRRLSFYRRPAWELRVRDDALLNVVEMTRGGQSHQVRNVITSEAPPLPFVAFEHHWDTTRVVTTSGPNGTIQTTTVTDHHQENIFEMAMTFDMPYLEVTGNRALGKWLGRGERVEFEMAAFNDSFDVRSTSPKFAYDVVHPRQIEYLMQVGPPPFAIGNKRIRVVGATHSPEAVDYTYSAISGFLARIPAFVWQNLGVPVPDFDGDGRPGPTFDQHMPQAT